MLDRSISRRGLLALGAALSLSACSAGGGAPDGGSPQAEVLEDRLADAAASALNALTWQEVAELSARISAAGDDAEAAAIGAAAGVLDADGVPERSQAKVVELSDGTLARVRVVGYRRGALSDGTRAGLVLAFADAIASRGVTGSRSTEGGWAASELRSWLNGEALGLLPEDLRAVIRPAYKTTVASLGEEPGYTDDALWLLSESELAGEGAAEEGEALQLFEASPQGTPLFDDAFRRYDRATGAWDCWWERSLDPARESFLFRSYGGGHTQAIKYGPNFELGVAPGFCL